MIQMEMNGLVERLRVRMFDRVWPQPAQYILLSYPKSGRTWVRFMIDSYLVKRNGRFVHNVFEAEKDPIVHRYHRVKFTHLMGEEDLNYYEMGSFKHRTTLVPKSHVVLLTRNIYATLASAYNQARYRIGRVVTPSDFIREPKEGAIKIISFYNFWLQLRSEFLSSEVFSYEALKADPKGVFRQILEAVGISPIDERLLEEVVAQSTFQRLQVLALTDAYKDTVLGPTDHTSTHRVDPTNKNSWKVREGKTHGFREVFSEEDLLYIKRLIDDLLIDKTIVDISL